MVNTKGKWALITGASRGVGYETAIFMAQQGCNLILHSRTLEHTKALEEEVKNLGVEVYSVQAELANHEEVVAMLDEIEAKGTQVDIVFNNAAVQIAYRTDYWNTPVEGNEPEQAGYAASKAALDKFTKDLASRLEGTDVMLNLTDPGWCRTDLGGPSAPNDVKSVIPGIAIGAFVDDKKSGRFFPAQSFTGLSLEEAVVKAEQIEAQPHVI